MCIKLKFKEICLKLATNGRSDKGFLLTSKVCLQGVFCPCPGAIYMYKIIKMCIKSDFEEIILKLATYGQREKAFLLTSKFCPQMDYLPLQGAIYIWWNMKKMYIKSDFKAVFFKPVTNGQSDKGFLLTSKVCPQGVVCSCPGAIYIYKIIKNVYKIRFLFLNLQGMGIVIRAFCWHQNFVPKGLSVPALGLYMCLKWYFKEIVLKLATNGQSDKGILLTSTFVPKGLSAPALGLYTCIKALNYIQGPGVRWAFTGPLV